ncbi:MAG: ATP synthase F1 subunit delta [Ruminococcaceae bacterium]|nr:ATP synthase F1 subunit delta [Oscillospiraceae bacterium]
MKSLSLTYAASLFALAEEENIVDDVMDQLREIDSVIKENREYASLLDSPTLSLEQRTKLIDEAFSSFHEYVSNFLKILCEKKCVYIFPECVKHYEKLFNKKNNIENVTVITAMPLSEELCSKLTSKLEKESGKKVCLDLKVDKSILGGIILRTENSQTDASVRARLDAIKMQLES